MKDFVDKWFNRGYEKGEAQTFWNMLLRDMFSLERPEDWIICEQQINGKFIDAHIPSTRVLIEQKSIGRDLDAAFEQAKDYDNELPFNQKSRWIVCCDLVDKLYGALFESTLNPETRRIGGMYFTSIENIHRALDPLFLDKLRAEFKACGRDRCKLLALQKKLASLTFFDPACGSGNFLIETYLSLRRLENEILKKLFGDKIQADGIDNPIKVSINQFYGIEINGFAVAVAQMAIVIAESQMMIETQEIIHKKLNFLPLKKNVNIVRGNALTADWKSLVPDDIDYIIGNPPFVGASMMNAQQKAELISILGKGKLTNSIDYVGAWYYKATAFMSGARTRAAFVSTNSITQGEQVAPLWEKLFKDSSIHIDFAHRTFKWDNELHSASVHCVVVGFSAAPNDAPKIIFDGKKKIVAKNINPYLLDAPNIFVWSRAKPISPDAPRMTHGNKPTDGGNLILSTEERTKLLKSDPKLEVCIRRYVGGRDFINNDEVRWCLWLKDIEPGIYRKSREIMRRLKAVTAFRSKSTSKPTRDMAEYPFLFFSTTQTDANCLCIPEISSHRRKYIPIGFADPSIVVSNKMLILPGTGLYEFGVLTSTVHMAWVKSVAGRMGTSYQYSTSVVYNTFPWCTPTEAQRLVIEETAQKILDVRAEYEGSSLADLYDPKTMPKDLRRAHAANDQAVLAAYGFDKNATEEEIVAHLILMYDELTKTEANT